MQLQGCEAYDLLNQQSKCYVREDGNGEVQIRGTTSKDEQGFVSSSYSIEEYVSSQEELVAVVQKGLEARVTGNSDAHDQSSRSHAFLEFEVVTSDLIQARENVRTIQSQLTKSGHEKDSLEMAIFLRTHVQKQGRWERIPGARGSTDEECQTISRLANEKKKYEKELKEAQEQVHQVMEASPSCVGGTLGKYLL